MYTYVCVIKKKRSQASSSAMVGSQTSPHKKPRLTINAYKMSSSPPTQAKKIRKN